MRFRSMAVFEAASAKPSCRLLPASSSRCKRVIPIFFLPPLISPLPSMSMSMNPNSCQWLVILRNLVALGQVRIKIIFPRKDGNFIDPTLQGHSRQRREFHGFAIQNGQSSRKSQTNRAHISIWRIAKARRARAEDFRRGQQLNVDFESNNRLIFRKEVFRNGRNRSHPRNYNCLGDGEPGVPARPPPLWTVEWTGETPSFHWIV